MSQVIGLEYAADAAAPTPALIKVLKASWAFGLLFTVLFAALVLLAALMAGAMLFYDGPHLQVDSQSFELTQASKALPSFIIVGTLPWATKAAYAIVAVARTLPAIMLFWNLRLLFRLYAAGQVFAPRNAAVIKTIGLWLVASALSPFACHLFLSSLGRELDHAWFHMQEVQAFVLGGQVFVIAQVMQVGHEIEEDRSQFV
jgi:hypothetical protein